jgi:hypothetical protein
VPAHEGEVLETRSHAAVGRAASVRAEAYHGP